MSWKDAISRDFGAVIAAAVIGVAAAEVLAELILSSSFLWDNPTEFFTTPSDLLIIPVTRFFHTWLFLLFVNVLLLALTSAVVAIKVLPDAIIDTILPRSAVPRATSWRDAAARIVSSVNLDGKIGIIVTWPVLLTLGGIVGIRTAGDEEWLLSVGGGVIGAVIILAGLILTIVGVYAVAISSITNSVADHMPESDAVSRISDSESMRLAYILALSMAAIWIAGGAFIGIGMSIAANATQGTALLILTGALMMILGNAGMVFFIRQFSSTIADHLSDDSIRNLASPSESDFRLFFQFLAVLVLAGAPLLFGIATIDAAGGGFLVWLWLWSWPAILIFVLGYLAVATSHVSNSVAAIVRRRAEIAARRE